VKDRKRSILRSGPYKSSKDWTLNPFKPRFYTEWTTVYNFELVIEDIYRESALPPLALKKLFWGHRNGPQLTIIPQYLYKDMSQENINFLAQDEQYLLPELASSSDLIGHRSDESEGEIQLIGQKLRALPTLREKTDSEVVLRNVNDDCCVDFGRALPDVYKEGYETTQEMERKRVESATTYFEVLNSAPSLLKMEPFQPTPKHFDLVPFDYIMKEGVGLTEDEVASKGRHLSVCIWLMILFLLSFTLFFAIALIKFVIASFVVGHAHIPYFISTLYLGTAAFLSLTLYVSYQHMYWQYCRNKFGSLYDFYQDVKLHPNRLLPIFFERNLKGDC